MDRRQVEHVEAHRGDVGQQRRGVVEGARSASDRCREERGNISYQAPKRARSRSTVTCSIALVASGGVAVRVPGHGRRPARRERLRDALRLFDSLVTDAPPRPVRAVLAVGRLDGAIDRAADQRGAFQQLAR